MLPFDVESRKIKNSLENKILVILATDQTYIKHSEKLHCCRKTTYLADLERSADSVILTMFTGDAELAHINIDSDQLRVDSKLTLDDVSENLLKQKINSLGSIRKDGEKFYYASFDGKNFNKDGTLVILDEDHNVTDINQFDSGIYAVASFKDNLVVALRNKLVYAYPLFERDKIINLGQFSKRFKRIEAKDEIVFLVNNNYVYSFDTNLDHSETYSLTDCVSLDSKEDYVVFANDKSVYSGKKDENFEEVISFDWTGTGRKIGFIGIIDKNTGLLGLTNGDYFSFDLNKKYRFNRSDEIYKSTDFKKVLSLEEETGKTNKSKDYVKRTFMN